MGNGVGLDGLLFLIKFHLSIEFHPLNEKVTARGVPKE